MKSHEFINEGLGDWAAKKGLFGREAQFKALGAQLGKERQLADELEAENTAKLLKQQYSRSLQQALVQGEEGKLIRVGSSNQGVTVSQFLTQYIVNSLLKKYHIEPTMRASLDNSIKEFERAYQGGGKLPPVSDSIWSAIGAIKTSNYKPPVPGKQQTQPGQPKAAQAPGAAAPGTVGAARPGTAAPAQRSAAGAGGGAGAFGQMAQQLAQPTKSSTGGTITQTSTGLRHRAKPQ